jgi:hypothetical protein
MRASKHDQAKSICKLLSLQSRHTIVNRGAKPTAAKLDMQLAEVEGRLYNQVVLDLTKAYDTVDRPRLFEIWEAYGVGTRQMDVLKDSWEESVVVPRLVRCFGQPVERSQAEGCYFPFVFQLDGRRNTSCRRGHDDGCAQPHEKATLHFYADDHGRIAGDNPDLIQSYLDKFLELFAVVGLQMKQSRQCR